MSTTTGVQELRLEALPHELASATFPDSFTAMGFGERFGYPADPKPYHGRVFLLDELDDVIARYGLPSPTWEQNHEDWLKWPEATYIEVQLWDDEPVREHLAATDETAPT